MKTYSFRVVIEPDEDRWFAYSPALEYLGGATWRYTKEEARANIYEVLKMTVESMIDRGELIPEESAPDSESSRETRIAITI